MFLTKKKKRINDVLSPLAVGHTFLKIFHFYQLVLGNREMANAIEALN